MEIGELQQSLRATYLERDAGRGRDATFRWLVEEIGELARAMRTRDRDELLHEFGDVLARRVTLVAERAGRVIGVLDMEYHQRLGDHRPQARVNDVVVTEAERGEGVGTALVYRAEELARKRGCFRMALVTADWRERSHTFYARHGWAGYGAWVVYPLTDGVGPYGQPVDVH